MIELDPVALQSSNCAAFVSWQLRSVVGLVQLFEDPQSRKLIVVMAPLVLWSALSCTYIAAAVPAKGEYWIEPETLLELNSAPPGEI